ncbi:2OG-Fe(II) oxygenase [Streptomyces sp. AB3(2024)]|uniref:2OG-Fe(II) oxygenase n=1 Tax=Streptomyces sp. AB3(2024) TaxID=3317321 RepID=UPI0035A2CD9A
MPELTAAIDELLPGVERTLAVDCRDTESLYGLNVYGDGDFFVPHQDSWDTFRPGRVVTFVYCLHRTPRPFTGGTLRVFDGASSLRTGGRPLAREDRAWRDYEPEHDGIVFFRPTTWHEARRVQCPGGQPRDCRFAVNGWLTRRDADAVAVVPGL